MSWNQGKTCKQAKCRAADKGACCLGPGLCETLTPAQCETRGGTYAADQTCGGAGQFCTPMKRIGACCLPDGSCADMSERMCLDMNGSLDAEAWCVSRPCADAR